MKDAFIMTPYIDNTMTLYSTRQFKLLLKEIIDEKNEIIKKEQELKNSRTNSRKSLNSLSEEQQLQEAMRRSLESSPPPATSSTNTTTTTATTTTTSNTAVTGTTTADSLATTTDTC
jgi:hypothetical protein